MDIVPYITKIISRISDVLRLSNVSLSHGGAITVLMLFATLLNLPFGYLRQRQRKRSFKWFLYIHLPIPFVILMRSMVHLDYKYIPLSLAASVLGQIIGGKL